MRLTTLAIMAAAALCGLTGAVQAGPTATCYINDGYGISAVPDGLEANDIISVQRKSSPQQAVMCPLPADEADLVLGEGDFGLHYVDLVADHLVLERSTGPVGDVVVVDLRSGKTILEAPAASYQYTSDDGIHYSERREDGTAETCDSFEELTALGLGTAIAYDMVLNLETGKTTETGTVSCEGVS